MCVFDGGKPRARACAAGHGAQGNDPTVSAVTAWFVNTNAAAATLTFAVPSVILTCFNDDANMLTKQYELHGSASCSCCGGAMEFKP